MDEEEKLRFWGTVWKIYYRSYFHEILSELVLARLTTITRVVDVLTATTASGSAVAAWSVWKTDGMSLLWVFLSSTTALLSILIQALGVRDWVRRYSDSRLAAQSLRLRIEYFRNKLQITNEWDKSDLMFDLQRFQEIFEALLKQHPQDKMVETTYLKNRAQDDVDRILADEISAT